MYSSTLSLTLTLDGLAGGQHHARAASRPRKGPGTHCTGGWVGSRVGFGGCRKSHLPPGVDPLTVQPVTSRYTDYAIPVDGLCW
jgi:hypothetical protein